MGSEQKKKWIMNAFAMSSPGHVAAGILNTEDLKVDAYRIVAASRESSSELYRY